MKISCIIPTFNRNGFLLEAVNSVLKQTLPPFEIIIVNNGENEIDLPVEILEKIKIYNIVYRAGASQARNFGASFAQGEYLAFLDDDDLWENNYLFNIVKAHNGDTKCFVSGLDKLKEDSIEGHKNVGNNLKIKNLLTYNPGITGSNVVVERDAFLKIGGFDVLLPTSEDKSLIIELLRREIVIKTLPENKAIIRFHENERLTNAPKMAEGIYAFTRKYINLMTCGQRVSNLKKVYKLRYKKGERVAGIQYLALKLLSLFLKEK